MPLRLHKGKYICNKKWLSLGETSKDIISRMDVAYFVIVWIKIFCRLKWQLCVTHLFYVLHYKLLCSVCFQSEIRSDDRLLLSSSLIVAKRVLQVAYVPVNGNGFSQSLLALQKCRSVAALNCESGRNVTHFICVTEKSPCCVGSHRSDKLLQSSRGRRRPSPLRHWQQLGLSLAHSFAVFLSLPTYHIALTYIPSLFSPFFYFFSSVSASFSFLYLKSDSSFFYFTIFSHLFFYYSGFYFLCLCVFNSYFSPSSFHIHSLFWSFTFSLYNRERTGPALWPCKKYSFSNALICGGKWDMPSWTCSGLKIFGFLYLYLDPDRQ